MSTVNVVVRYNGKLYKSTRYIDKIRDCIHNIGFVENNISYLTDNILIDNIFTKMAPSSMGLIVVDFDSNIIINYNAGSTVGTIKKGHETESLKDFYDKKRVILDEIDYMLDLRPFVVDNYNYEFASDGELVIKKLLSLGFKLTKDELKQWNNWFASKKRKK